MKEVPARVLGTDGKTEIKIKLSFTYDLEDPFAFGMKFHRSQYNDEVEWFASLELLRDGLEGPAGIGDFQVWPEGQHLALRIESHAGVSITRVPALAVTIFLKKVERENVMSQVKVEDVVRLATEQFLEDLGLYPYDSVPDMSGWISGPSLPDNFCHHCLRVHVDEECED